MKIPLVTFYNLYRFQVEGWAYNHTISEESSDESETSSESAGIYSTPWGPKSLSTKHILPSWNCQIVAHCKRYLPLCRMVFDGRLWFEIWKHRTTASSFLPLLDIEHLNDELRQKKDFAPPEAIILATLLMSSVQLGGRSASTTISVCLTAIPAPLNPKIHQSYELYVIATFISRHWTMSLILVVLRISFFLLIGSRKE